MKNLYIDFDGVILDTIRVTYEMLDSMGISPKDLDKTTKFYLELDWEQLLNNTPVINDGINCIKRIIDSNKFNVAILTHIYSLNEGTEKVKYIRKYFDDITVIPVPKTISKTQMVHTEDAILIDDYSPNLIEWENAGGIGIRFNLELESKGFKVIDRLDKVIDMF